MALLPQSRTIVPLLSKRQPKFVLFSFAIGIFGLQGVFATVFAHGSLQLEAVGFEKSIQSLIWLVGPLCGTLIQPCIGVVMDQYQGTLERRPFIFLGGMVAFFSLVGFTCADRVPIVLRYWFGGDAGAWKSVPAATTVLCFIVLNLSIQPIQCGLRTLAVDIFPHEQQTSAAAWASAAVNFANVFYYGIAFASSHAAASTTDLAQLKFLGIVASFGLGISVCITCMGVSEVPHTTLQRRGTVNVTEICGEPRQALASLSHLPPEIRRVFQIQFFSWLGWFPFLFYIVNFVRGACNDFREMQQRNLRSKPNNSWEQDAVQHSVAHTSHGQLVLLLFSVVALVSGASTQLLLRKWQQQSTTTASHSQHVVLRRLWIAWAVGHVIFTISITAATLASSISWILCLVPVAGVSWFITSWAPFAIIGTVLRGTNHEIKRSITEQRANVIQAGGIFGLHNAVIAAPQVLSALLCSLVFWLSSSDSAIDGTRWVLRSGAASALVAAWLTIKQW